jgi:hypothetical protein
MLLENRRDYEAMFKGFPAEAQAEASRFIEQCKSRLKRKDRIIWMLRYERFTFMAKYSPLPTEQLQRERLAYAGKYRLFDGWNIHGDMRERGYNPADMTAARCDGLLRQIEHYISLPIPAIQTFVFDKQSVIEVLNYFEEVEEAWKSEAKQVFSYDGADGEVIENCGDNWFWVLLPRAYCPNEADAMGHCGNSPRAHSTDRIISLRRLIMKDNRPFWRPSLTFIINDAGFLTEMKGRGNGKPATKYHPQIKQLLLNPIVHGIEGGGYMAQNNFALGDLPKDQVDALVDQKPELGTAYDWYKKMGITDDIQDRIRADFLRGFQFAHIMGYYTPPSGQLLDGKLIIDKQRFLSNLLRPAEQRKVTDIENTLDRLESNIEALTASSHAEMANDWFYFDFLFRTPKQLKSFLDATRLTNELLAHFGMLDKQGIDLGLTRMAATALLFKKNSKLFMEAREQIITSALKDTNNLIMRLMNKVISGSDFYSEWTFRIEQQPAPENDVVGWDREIGFYYILADLERILEMLDMRIKTPDSVPDLDVFEKEIVSRRTWPSDFHINWLVDQMNDIRDRYNAQMRVVVSDAIKKLHGNSNLRDKNLLRLFDD